MFTLIVGPMFSGKSSLLLNYERRFKIANKNILTINHSFDRRYSETGQITTHDQVVSTSKHHMSVSTEHMDQIINNDYGDFHDFDVIIIDEIQFFNPLDRFISYWAKMGKLVIGAGLNSDYKMQPFSSMSCLYSIADKIIHICATCSKCGEDAPFTKRLINDKTTQISVGGAESYEPRCRKCFNLEV
jgi:thymidine kinase